MLKHFSLMMVGACTLLGSTIDETPIQIDHDYYQTLMVQAKVGPVIFDHAHEQVVMVTKQSSEGLEYEVRLLGASTSASIPSAEGALQLTLDHDGAEDTPYLGRLTPSGVTQYREGSDPFEMKGVYLGALPNLNVVQKGAIEAGLLDLTAAFAYPLEQEPVCAKPVSVSRMDFDNDGESTRTTHWVYTLEEAALDKEAWHSVFESNEGGKVYQFVAPFLNNGETTLSGELVYEGTWDKEDPMVFDLVVKGHLVLDGTEMKLKIKLESEID